MEKRTRDEWRRQVRDWRRSGLTAKEFAASRGLSASTLAWWSWRLRTMEGQAATKPRSRSRVQPAALRLIPVKLDSGHAHERSETHAVRWELETPDGLVLRVFVDGPELPRVVEQLLGKAERRS